MMITDRADFPECLRNIKAVNGIHVGGCCWIRPMRRKGKRVAYAHAHHLATGPLGADDPFRGFICLKYRYLLREPFVLIHEAAHIIANKTTLTHHKEWRACVRKLGGTHRPFTMRNGVEMFGWRDEGPYLWK
jgi:hypothetical protein